MGAQAGRALPRRRVRAGAHRAATAPRPTASIWRAGAPARPAAGARRRRARRLSRHLGGRTRGAQLATLAGARLHAPRSRRPAALARPSNAARRSCWSPTPPGEAAATTCRSGRHCTRSSRTSASRSDHRRARPCADDPRPFIEAAAPTHPSLIDTEHRLADLYGIINVPTAIWIDEHGIIVRPNDVAFGSEMFKDLTGFDSAPTSTPCAPGCATARCRSTAREAPHRQMLPNAEEQLARAEFGLAWHLHKHGRAEAAAAPLRSAPASCRRTTSPSGAARCPSAASTR